MKTLQEEFDEMHNEIHEGYTTPEQYMDMRRAFFAGALTMFNNWLDIWDADKEGQSLNMLDTMKAELDDFVEKVKLGTR